MINFIEGTLILVNGIPGWCANGFYWESSVIHSQAWARIARTWTWNKVKQSVIISFHFQFFTKVKAYSLQKPDLHTTLIKFENQLHEASKEIMYISKLKQTQNNETYTRKINALVCSLNKIVKMTLVYPYFFVLFKEFFYKPSTFWLL